MADCLNCVEYLLIKTPDDGQMSNIWGAAHGLRPIINVCPPPICVGAGLPANTVAAATVNDGGELASRPGPFAGEPAPTRRPAPNHQCVPTTNLCRSGFTREYGGGGDGEWRVEIGLQPPLPQVEPPLE